jgi:hypothetical protein
MIDYYAGLRTEPVRNDFASPCRLLLLYADYKIEKLSSLEAEKPGEIDGWERVWTFERGRRKKFETLYLYIRQNHE